MARRWQPAVVLLWGVFWAISAVIEAQDPNPFDPVTTLDFAAVWTYSLVLVLSAIVAWGLVPPARTDRALAVIGGIVATGFVAAGVATLIASAWFAWRLARQRSADARADRVVAIVRP